MASMVVTWWIVFFCVVVVNDSKEFKNAFYTP